MTPKYGPFPATNNNARLVFYFIFLPYTRVYILNFSSSLNIWESIMPFQLANHVPRTNVMKGFISLLYAWSQPSGKCVWENPNERTDSNEWRDDTVLNCIPLKLAGGMIKAKRYNYIKNLVKIIITNFRFLLGFLVQRG